ncbi:oxidoreductase [Hypoxylon fragiforme]|uniref:oxidoreductase n=1 Tax=Hypoxylon fragiforme TaxID=63214 RepID=UPI0020C62091|nr:oxidoreductase [Hypoxylon fragiforme]KAI2611647.1 oxidoreductase [Hypoxylon fragiforme]
MHAFSVLMGLLSLGLAQQKPNVQLIDPINRFKDMNLSLPPPSDVVLQSSFEVRPDCGETSYKGNGRLQGLKTLITGGDSGIGRAVVIAFLREGAQVAINYLPEEESDAEDLAKTLEPEGLTFERIPGNLLNETFCANLVKEASDRLGGIDIAILNAAHPGNLTSTIEHQETSHLERIFRTNVFANFFLVRALTPILPRGGTILFTTSDIVNNPAPTAVDYGASKASISHMIRALAHQLAPRGIRVNGVAPSITYTPALPGGGYTTEFINDFAANSVWGRIEQPAELAPFFVALADPQGSFASATILSTTGGEPGPH